VPDHLQKIAASPAEAEEMAAERIALQDLCATSASEANPSRISVWPVASHTFTPTGAGSSERLKAPRQLEHHIDTVIALGNDATTSGTIRSRRVSVDPASLLDCDPVPAPIPEQRSESRAIDTGRNAV
jgi:hypothetical protein